MVRLRSPAETTTSTTVVGVSYPHLPGPPGPSGPHSPGPPGQGLPAGPASSGHGIPRPVDIDTGCWLWLAALPLMIISYVAATVGQWHLDATVRASGPLWHVYASDAFICVVAGSLVVTAIFLMRSGYRLARTFLTGGAIGSVVFTVMQLFSLDGPSAIVQALSGIPASVLIAGGLYLLHRDEASKYLTRTR